ncbi:uncharacterized protein [Nicotiana tomentosiformis]|uniref:uncharacterized protein isoform X2 n=1 Tax=Nicotiana tomentosiformis TaxID=4098 RepID=UPI000878AB0F|nr:uncharacterized protein LOC104106036 isoform X2 [Nicotiana tomentosiformis]
MAELVAFPSSSRLLVKGNFSEQLSVSKSSAMLIHRGFCFGNCGVSRLPSSNISKLITPSLTKLESRPNMHSCKRGFSVASLVNADVAITFELVPAIDQMLLMTSIYLTYLAGVIPSNTREQIKSKNVDSDGTSSSGRRKDNDINTKFAWDVVKGKLLSSLSSAKEELDFGAAPVEFEQNRRRQPSNLYALAEGPRLRLLWASFQLLKKEVDCISANAATLSKGNFLAIYNDVIKNSCQPLCVTWLEEELLLKSNKTNKECLSIVIDKLDGHGNVLMNIKKSGKEDLYAELICFLRFGFIRKDDLYDNSLFMEHGVSILEDLVIMLADGIASMYLGLISVDSSMSNEMNNLGLSLCTMSTRALQKLRNEVALNQWLHQNMEAVVSMYEDRFDLCIFQYQLVEESSKDKDQTINWWKKLNVISSRPVSRQLNVVVIDQISVPVKRTKELRALTGWRYYYSLFLELADIAMPLVRTVIAKVLKYQQWMCFVCLQHWSSSKLHYSLYLNSWLATRIGAKEFSVHKITKMLARLQLCTNH